MIIETLIVVTACKSNNKGTKKW